MFRKQREFYEGEDLSEIRIGDLLNLENKVAGKVVRTINSKNRLREVWYFHKGKNNLGKYFSLRGDFYNSETRTLNTGRLTTFFEGEKYYETILKYLEKGKLSKVLRMEIPEVTLKTNFGAMFLSKT